MRRKTLRTLVVTPRAPSWHWEVCIDGAVVGHGQAPTRAGALVEGRRWMHGPDAAPDEAAIIDAVCRCIHWCAPELPEITAATVRHNWRRFLKKS